MTCEEHLQRIRVVCAELPQTTEKRSLGEPTFFVAKRVYAMFANNHHGDGRIAVWLPVPPGLQTVLIETEPETFYRPPYVGGRGWVGIVLDNIDDEELAAHLHQAWRLIAPAKVRRQEQAVKVDTARDEGTRRVRD